jgi:putative NADH-flavin reductase
MRLLVVGANGRTGRLLVRRALDHGHDVTAFVRSAPAPGSSDPRASTIVGDALSPETLPPAMAGQDAVVSLLAPRPRRNGRVYVEGTRNLADAAAAAGVRRFVAVSAEGAGVDPRLLPLGYRLVMRIPVVARLYPDIARMDRDLEGRSQLDWTIVAPAVLTNGPSTGGYRVVAGGVVPGGLSLSRADLAAFLLEVVESGAHVHERVSVAT